MRTTSFHTLAVTLALLLLALPGLKIFANDGDTFVSESPEGIKLNYKVICEQDKTAEENIEAIKNSNRRDFRF